jgi:hypothetical protein
VVIDLDGAGFGGDGFADTAPFAIVLAGEILASFSSFIFGPSLAEA